MPKDNKNILVLTYWSFNDALIQTYTLPYVEIIARNVPDNTKVFLLSLDKTKTTNATNNSKIINVSHAYKPLGLRGLLMLVMLIFKLYFLIKKQGIRTIHAWCTQAGALGYILSKLTGAKLIIDSFEPHAETMVENGVWKKNSLAFKLLFKFEKLQVKRASYLIVCTEAMKQYAKEKYDHDLNNYFVKPACVNLELFSEVKVKNKKLLDQLDLQDKIVCVYAGKFGGIYLENEVFDFFKVAEDFWGSKFRILILSSHTQQEIENYRLRSKLSKESLIHRFVPHAEIAEYIGLGDFAITPVKPIPTKRYCTPIKDGEYWALGLPVVITKDISDDSDIIKENQIGSILQGFDTKSYLRSIKEIDSLFNGSTKTQLYNKIRAVAEKYRNFEIARKIYKEIYKSF